MLSFRHAQNTDADLYFKWVNDELVRKNSLNTEKIDLQDHHEWFSKKIENQSVFMYLFMNNDNTPVGQVIIERKKEWVAVGQSIAKEHRGKRYSSEMLTKATNDFLMKYPKDTIVSVVKTINVASIKMSINSGFTIVPPEDQNNNTLVLKGFRQNDELFKVEAKHIFNLP